MYSVTITNNYFHTITLDNPDANKVGSFIPPGGTQTFEKWGNHILFVPGMGPINFIDLGDKKLNGYVDPKLKWTESTWGGLIRYRGLDAYFRYEGGGEVTGEVDAHGCLHLSFAQGGAVISLADVTVAS